MIVDNGADIINITIHVSNSVVEQKQDVITDLKESFSATTKTSPKKKIMCVFSITHKQQPHLTFTLPAISIHIFARGGTLIVAVNFATCRRQFKNFRSCSVFSFLVTAWSPCYFVPSVTLLWEPWDRGKKNYN